MEYLIREFREEDIHALIELCYKHAAYEQFDYDRRDKEHLLISALVGGTPKLYCWVVVVNDSVVGYTTFTFDFSTWHANHFLHLDCLYIEETYRGLGIGKEIIQRLKVIAKSKGCVNVQWQTPMSNEDAIRFYHRMGSQSKDKKRFFLET